MTGESIQPDQLENPTACDPWTVRDVPSGSGVSSAALPLTLSTARSVDSSRPRIVASTTCLSANCTVTFVAPATTCAFVRIVPSRLTTKPEPVASPRCCWGKPKSNGDCVFSMTCARMKTTPGAVRL